MPLNAREKPLIVVSLLSIPVYAFIAYLMLTGCVGDECCERCPRGTLPCGDDCVTYDVMCEVGSGCACEADDDREGESE